MSKKWFVAALVIIGLVVFGAFSLQAQERQPHMKTALEHLEKAKTQLEKAAPGKGGHRVKAIELINSAIAEVRKGMEFDEPKHIPGRR